MEWICTSCAKLNPPGADFCGACGTRRRAPGDSRIGEVVLGRYRISSKLGEGAMGAVYRAEQSMGTATRPVAVKVLHAALTHEPALRSRFERECELVIQLEHPNTIKFYDFGALEDGSLAIVMEYVSGESLADRIARGPLPVDAALDVLGQVCGSLHEAHARGMVHRDLKPDNILLAERAGRRDFVKVLDFGIAKQQHAQAAPDGARPLTMQGTVLGTPPYMSPEQFAGSDLDARSDIYSLGVITYEMLTGTYPFPPTSNVFEWARRHLHDPPLPIDEHAVAHHLAPRARAALMRALAKEPAARPTGALELAREVIGAERIDTGWGLATIRAAPAPAPSTGIAPTAAISISDPGLWLPGTAHSQHPHGSGPPSETGGSVPPSWSAPASRVRASRVVRNIAIAIAALVVGALTAVGAYVVFLGGRSEGAGRDRESAPTARADAGVTLAASTEPDAPEASAELPHDPHAERVHAAGEAALDPVAGPIPTEWLRIVHYARSVEEPSAAIGAPDGVFATIAPGGVLTLELLPGSQIATDGGPGPDVFVAVDDGRSGAYRVEAAQGHEGFRVVVSDVAGTLPLDLDQYRLGTVRYLRISARSSRPVLLDAVGAYRITTRSSAHHH